MTHINQIMTGRTESRNYRCPHHISTCTKACSKPFPKPNQPSHKSHPHSHGLIDPRQEATPAVHRMQPAVHRMQPTVHRACNLCNHIMSSQPVAQCSTTRSSPTLTSSFYATHARCRHGRRNRCNGHGHQQPATRLRNRRNRRNGHGHQPPAFVTVVHCTPVGGSGLCGILAIPDVNEWRLRPRPSDHAGTGTDSA